MYHGPVQSIPLAVKTAKDKDGTERSAFKDFDFLPGRPVDGLPEDNALVQSMIARKLLRPVPAKAAAKPSSDTKGDSK